LEADLEAEVRAYRDLLMDRYIERGFPIDEARRSANIELEGMEQVKEQVRAVRAGVAIDSALQDLRHAFRALAKSPAFAVVVLLTLTLGIGVNTAIFSVVYAVLLRPLPYHHPDRLALIWSTFESAGSRAPASAAILHEVSQRNRAFQDVAGIWMGEGTFTGDQNPEQVRVGFVTPNFMEVLGIRPALGRLFEPGELFGGRPVMLLSNGLWQRRFGGDPGMIGRSVAFQGVSATVVGILSPDFELHFATDSGISPNIEVFAPFGYNIYKNPRTLYFLRMLARLKPDVGLAQAQQDMDATAAQIRGSYTEFAAEKLKLDVMPLHDDSVRDVRAALIALFVGAGFVLLICCVNVANLLLARASERRKEIAVRAALGASQGRIIRQLLTEGILLCTVAGVLGLGLGWAGVRWLVALRPASLVRLGAIGLNWPVLAFVVAVSLASVLLFGLAPSIETAKWDLIKILRESGRSSQTTVRRGIRGALIVSEIALGFVLVIGAGLMIRTFVRLQQVQPGFEPRSVLTFGIDLSGRRYPDNLTRIHFVKDWEARLKTIPGVESLGAVSHLPLGEYSNWYSPYRPEGVTKNQGAGQLADYRSVTSGYFRTMGTRLLDGRQLDEHDNVQGRKVVIVDDMLARATWPGQSPVGKKIEAEFLTSRGFENVWAEVVGVVEHVRDHSLSRQLRGQIYIPFEQSARTHLSYAIRTRVEPLALADTVRRELHQRDPELAITKIQPMTVYVEAAKAPASFTAVLAGIFAGLALLLAATGIYGVVYYSVSRRMHEMGVRMALGARGSDVALLVMREGLALTALGMALGVAGALAASRVLQGLIYGVSAIDPVSYAVALAVIPAAAILGCWRPSAQAAAANPVDAIRAE
jgi:putative ABC transport system permease protein